MLRRALSISGYAVALVALTVVSAVVHLPTSDARRAARDITNNILGGLFRGKLTVGSIDRLSLFTGLRATNLTLDDARGRRIIDGGTLEAGSLVAVLRSVLGRPNSAMPALELNVRSLDLVFDEDGIPSIAGAFESRDAPTPSRTQPRARPAATNAPPTLRFPSMRVTVARVNVGHPTVPVRVDNAGMRGSMVTEPFSLRSALDEARVDARNYGQARARGDFSLTMPAWTPARAQSQSDVFEGNLHAGAQLRGDELDCDVTLDIDRAGLRIDARQCTARASMISRLAGVPINVDARIAHVRLARTPQGPMAIEADARVGDSPVFARVSLGEQTIDATVNVDQLDLSRIRANLPSTELTGRVRFTRDRDTLTIDTRELTARVAGQSIPGATARGRLGREEIALEAVEIPLLGMRATGRVALGANAGDLEVDAEGAVPDAARVELLRELELAGNVRYRAHVTRRAGELSIDFDVNGRDLRVPGGVRIASGGGRGNVRIAADGAVAIRADARGNGVRVRGFGPADGNVHIEGDPRRAMRGRFRVSGDNIAALPGDPSRGPTNAEGSFSIDRDARETRVALGRTRVTLRGARGEVTASVRAPTRGRPTVAVQVETDDGGRVGLRIGANGIETELGQLPTDWIARALGLERGVGGNVAGDLRLVGGRPRGSLRWNGGSLPVVGPVELELEARADGGRDAVQGRLAYGSGANRPAVTFNARFDARAAARGGIDGVIRSIDSVDVRAESTPASILQQFAPPGVAFNGRADLAVHASRASRSAPLDTVFGFDVRQFVPTANLSAAVTTVLFGRRGQPNPNARGARPLTVPLRLRGAVCATVATARSVPERADLAVAWGADGSQPIQALPTQCALSNVDFREALVRAEAETGGPWHAALTGAIGTILSSRGSGKRWAEVTFPPEVLASMRDATVGLDLHLGPASPEQWPFTAAASRLMPALVRPPIDGTLDASIHVSGPLRAPSIRADIHGTSDAPAWLNVNDRARFDADITIATGRDGETVLDRALVDVDARTTLQRRDGTSNEGDARAVLELRTVVNPRSLFDGREGLRSVSIERASLRSTSLDLSRLAWARSNRVDGRMSLSLTDTGDATRPFVLNASVNALTVRNQQPSSVAIRAGLYDGCVIVRNSPEQCRLRDWTLRSCVSWAPGSQGTAGCDPAARTEYAPQDGLRMQAWLPLEGDWHEARPKFNEAQVTLTALGFPLERIAPIVERPPIVHIGGSLTSSLQWQARDPRLINGYFTIARGELTIERMGVPIRDIEMTAIAAAKLIRFAPAMTMHIGSGSTQGSLSAMGTIDLNGRQGELARIRVFPRVENFPAVQEGNLYAIITGALTFDARLFSDRMDGSLTIQNANVQVPEESSRSLQSLDEASGVFVLGRSRVSAPSQNRGFVTDLAFRTVDPIFLRRRDFLIGVTAEGGLRYDNAIYVRGAVSQFGRQNFFELFGKRFYFDRVSVLFDGSSSLDPLLDVALHYDSPTDGRIGITVTGHKNSPEIRFSAERYPGASDAEILAMLVLGRRESRGASDQATLEQQGRQAAASLLTAVLYGFGAGQVQRALESTGVGFVPTVIAEPGADGTALSRLGIGVLPSFLGNRVYIEGTYNQSQATGQGAQLLIDATINDHFSLGGMLGTSSNNGQRFGVDFFYTP
ncbi:MAG: translocation/assembly module TamB domain-containing protein [Myxococcales bacterium]|nr:translocation/assembly module TamB domain-containing protein [Myxococcales bacterium]